MPAQLSIAEFVRIRMIRHPNSHEFGYRNFAALYEVDIQHGDFGQFLGNVKPFRL
jgi:hypothetical protein